MCIMKMLFKNINVEKNWIFFFKTMMKFKDDQNFLFKTMMKFKDDHIFFFKTMMKFKDDYNFFLQNDDEIQR